jgi:hypothetical protein
LCQNAEVHWPNTRLDGHSDGILNSCQSKIEPSTRRKLQPRTALDSRAVFSGLRDDGTKSPEGFSPTTLAAKSEVCVSSAVTVEPRWRIRRRMESATLANEEFPRDGWEQRGQEAGSQLFMKPLANARYFILTTLNKQRRLGTIAVLPRSGMVVCSSVEHDSQDCKIVHTISRD